LVASVHPAERIKSISRLKLSEKNIQNSGTSGRLKKSGHCTVFAFYCPGSTSIFHRFYKKICHVPNRVSEVALSRLHSSFTNTSEFSEEIIKKNIVDPCKSDISVIFLNSRKIVIIKIYILRENF